MNDLLRKRRLADDVAISKLALHYVARLRRYSYSLVVEVVHGATEVHLEWSRNGHGGCSKRGSSYQIEVAV